MQSKVFSTNKTLNIRGKPMDLSEPKVMGIANITPDSFYDGGRLLSEASLLTHVEKMLEDGADFIDVGGFSTRPGAEDVSEAEELHRVLPAIRSIVARFPQSVLSVDTFRPEVARLAIDQGAAIVNDVTGSAKMFETVAQLKVPYILMHSRGTPQTMSRLTHYDNLIKEIAVYFNTNLQILRTHLVSDVLIDPGFGFAKTIDQNFKILNHLDYLQILGCPIVVGLSRKSMIWKTLGTDSEHALNGTTSLNTLALARGASILRVHEVREAIETVRLFRKTTAPAG